MKVAIYTRVSTTDKNQNPENQLLQLEDFCRKQGDTIHQVYEDRVSGRKGREDRQGFDQLLQDASQHQFDMVLFWSLDRFTREGIKKTIYYLQLLESYGVKFKSYTEQYLDSGNELFSHILVGVLSYLANQEAVKLSERTKAGLDRARRQGKRLGRPGLDATQQLRIRKLKAGGKSNNAISRKLKVSLNTVKKYLPAKQEVG